MKHVIRFSLMVCAVALFFAIGGFLSQQAYAADSIILDEDGEYNISELGLPSEGEEGYGEARLSIRANVTINVDKNCAFPSIYVSDTSDNPYDVVFKGNKTMTITGNSSSVTDYFYASNAKSLTIDGIKLVVKDKQHGIMTKYLTVKNATLDFSNLSGYGIAYTKDVTFSGTTIKISGCQAGLDQFQSDSSQAPSKLTISNCSVNIDNAKYNGIAAAGPAVIKNSELSINSRSTISSHGLTLSNVSGRLDYSSIGISSYGDLKIDNTNLRIIKGEGSVIGKPHAISLNSNSADSLPECIMDYSNYIKTPENSRFEYTDVGLTGEHNVLLDGNGDIALDVVIEKQEIPMGKCTIAAISSQKYKGSAITPAVKVKYNGEVLTKGKHYKVNYKNNTNAGKATVTVTGIAPFTGTKSTTFTITKATNPMTASGKTKTVKYAKVKKAKQVIARKDVISLSKKKGTVTYKKVKGNGKITVNKTTGKMTVKQGIKKGNYKVIVKVTDKGNNNYKAKTKTVTVTIKVK